MDTTIPPDKLTRPRRLGRAALVPLAVALIGLTAVTATTIHRMPDVDPVPADRTIPVELAPAQVLVP